MSKYFIYYKFGDLWNHQSMGNDSAYEDCDNDGGTMSDLDELELKIYLEQSARIEEGNEFNLYLQHCVSCKKFKRLSTSSPIGLGGTLSCPICRIMKQHGPGLEGSYGRVKVKVVQVTLPEMLRP